MQKENEVKRGRISAMHFYGILGREFRHSNQALSRGTLAVEGCLGVERRMSYPKWTRP